MDESQQLGSLAELSEYLSIASEDALASFPIESTAPLLVRGHPERAGRQFLSLDSSTRLTCIKMR